MLECFTISPEIRPILLKYISANKWPKKENAEFLAHLNGQLSTIMSDYTGRKVFCARC